MSILLGFLTILIIPPLIFRILIIRTKSDIRKNKKELKEKNKIILKAKTDKLKSSLKIINKDKKSKEKASKKRVVNAEAAKKKLEIVLAYLKSLLVWLKTLLHTIHVFYWTVISTVLFVIIPFWVYIIIALCVTVVILINITDIQNKRTSKDDAMSTDSINGTASTNEVYMNTVLAADVQQVVAMSDTEVWQLISGGRFKTKAEIDAAYQANPEEEKEFWESMVTDIEVPVWKWADSSHTSKVSSTTTIKVNKALVNYWRAFMNDLYACSDKYVVSMIGGFNVRPKNNGTGTKSLSAHSFGAVLDINWGTKGMGSVPAGISDGHPFNSCQGLSEPYRSECSCFDGNWNALIEKYKLDWGGNWSESSLDPMHFSLLGDNKKDTRRNAPKTAGQSPK